MSEMYLRQPRFIYNVCRPFNKNKKRIQFFKETGESRQIYLEEQLLIKCYMIKFIILLKMPNKVDIKDVFCFIGL